jgi:alpha-L-fucosidase 2
VALLFTGLLWQVASAAEPPPQSARPADAPADAKQVLTYDKPAKAWSAEALPLGNGRLGCMVFGGIATERVQFNDNSLWTGDANPSGDYASMGAYQNFGDLFLDIAAQPTPDPNTDAYHRSLSLPEAVHRVTFKQNGATHTRTMFASHPDNVIVLRWTADRPGALSGDIRLQGAHGETTKLDGDSLAFAGTLPPVLTRLVLHFCFRSSTFFCASFLSCWILSLSTVTVTVALSAEPSDVTWNHPR